MVKSQFLLILFNQSTSDLASLESRQESILSRLNDLKNQIDAIQGSKVQTGATGASQGSKISVQVCSNLKTFNN